jgi:hypothetical protein
VIELERSEKLNAREEIIAPQQTLRLHLRNVLQVDSPAAGRFFKNGFDPGYEEFKVLGTST